MSVPFNFQPDIANNDQAVRDPEPLHSAYRTQDVLAGSVRSDYSTVLSIPVL